MLSIAPRGVITSSTVMLSRSKRLSSMLRCLCGMYWPESITIARSSSTDSADWASSFGCRRIRFSSPRENRLMNHTAKYDTRSRPVSG